MQIQLNRYRKIHRFRVTNPCNSENTRAPRAHAYVVCSHMTRNLRRGFLSRCCHLSSSLYTRRIILKPTKSSPPSRQPFLRRGLRSPGVMAHADQLTSRGIDMPKSCTTTTPTSAFRHKMSTLREPAMQPASPRRWKIVSRLGFQPRRISRSIRIKYRSAGNAELGGYYPRRSRGVPTTTMAGGRGRETECCIYTY